MSIACDTPSQCSTPVEAMGWCLSQSKPDLHQGYHILMTLIHRILLPVYFTVTCLLPRKISHDDLQTYQLSDRPLEVSFQPRLGATQPPRRCNSGPILSHYQRGPDGKTVKDKVVSDREKPLKDDAKMQPENLSKAFYDLNPILIDQDVRVAGGRRSFSMPCKSIYSSGYVKATTLPNTVTTQAKRLHKRIIVCCDGEKCIFQHIVHFCIIDDLPDWLTRLSSTCAI